MEGLRRPTSTADTSRCPSYDLCGLTLAKGCSVCPSGFTNDGCTCRRDAHIFSKQSYYRGAGSPLQCSAALDEDAGLCYAHCANGYDSAATTCYGPCRYPRPPLPPYTGPGLTVAVRSLPDNELLTRLHPEEGRFAIRLAPGWYRLKAGDEELSLKARRLKRDIAKVHSAQASAS